MSKILIVEDDKNAINLYKQLLEREGYGVDTAEDGKDGLDKIKKGAYDLVLLDVMLPKMDGLAVLSALKKEPPAATPRKIVLMTNLTHNPVLQEARSLGAIDSIDKAGTSPDHFLVKIKKLLEG